jgi:hypothetical protein
MYVDHPELDDLDRRFLSALAPFANHHTGAGCHPGQVALEKACARSYETVRRHSRHVEKLGLVKLTGKANGLDNSNEWQICLDHPAFPDFYPSYDEAQHAERLSHIGPTQEKVSPTKQRPLAHKKESLAHKPTELAPRHGVGPTSTSTNTNNPPTGATNESKHIADTSAAVFGELVGMYLKAEERTPQINAVHKSELMKRIKENPEEVKAAWESCISVRPWNGETTHPFRYLLQNFEVYAAKAAHKVQRVISQEEQDAALAQFIETHNKVWAIPPPKESEDDDGSGLFGDEEPATPEDSNEEKQR